MSVNISISPLGGIQTPPTSVVVSTAGVQGVAGTTASISGLSTSGNVELTGTRLQTGKWAIPSGSGVFKNVLPSFREVFGGTPTFQTEYLNTGAWRYCNMTWNLAINALQVASVDVDVKYESSDSYTTVAYVRSRPSSDTLLDYRVLSFFLPPNCYFKFENQDNNPEYMTSQIMTWPV